MAETILTIFRRNSLRLGARPCLHYKEKGHWKVLNWVDAEEQVRRYALGLSALGLKPKARAAILSQTRLDWTLLDLAILANHAICVPLYSTLAANQIAYILKDADVSLLIVENLEQLERLQNVLKDFKGPIVLIDGPATGGSATSGEKSGAMSLEQLIEMGKKLPVNNYDDALRMIQPIDTASIVYTSGTTGVPKGSIITHRNILAEVEGLQNVFPFNENQIGLMCLPLAHVIARAMQFHQLAQGCQSAYAENLDLLPINLREVRPHYMAGVPRLFEKSYQKIMLHVAQGSKTAQKIFYSALEIGQKVSECRQKKLPIPFFTRVFYICANLFVFRKIRKRFGGRLNHMISGGAALPKSVAQFFHSIGMLIVEGYGLTETFAAITLNRMDDFRFGTVGKPMEGVRIKMAQDGEICVKGDTIFAGYLNKKEDSQAVFDAEGWFLTGDIGEFTKDGFLKITDRKRDIIVTSGGKNIAPQAIENLLQQSPYIGQAMVHGEGQRFLSALITLNWETVENYAKKNQIPYYSHKDLAQNEKIFALITKEIEKINATLSSFETIKKFAILEGNFTIESGELTPTMKIKRKAVVNKYKSILDGFYT